CGLEQASDVTYTKRWCFRSILWEIRGAVPRSAHGGRDSCVASRATRMGWCSWRSGPGRGKRSHEWRHSVLGHGAKREGSSNIVHTVTSSGWDCKSLVPELQDEPPVR
ncbi:unnamed protein product, partial [Durusdinium trenchii]